MAENDPTVMATVDSLWQVWFRYQEGYLMAVGTAVSRNRILTVYHGIRPTTNLIKARRMGTQDYHSLEIDHSRSGMDMLLLRFKIKTFQTPTHLKMSKSDDLKEGDDVWLVAMEDGEEKAFIEKIIVRSGCGPILDNFNSFVPNPIPFPTTRTYALLGDVEHNPTLSPNVPIFFISPYIVEPGHSGSPLVNKEGRIVGMMKGCVEIEKNKGVEIDEEEDLDIYEDEIYDEYVESDEPEGWRIGLHVSAIREFLEEGNRAREREISRRSRAVGFGSFARFRRAAMELPL